MANACATMKSLLTDYWTKANTDGKTPIFINAQDERDAENAKRIDVATRDKIKIYEEAPEDRRASGVGSQKIWRDNFLAIDIVSGITQLHAIKVKDEVVRILETNHGSPGTGFDYIEPAKDIVPFSGTRGHRTWRWVVSVKLINTNASLGA